MRFFFIVQGEGRGHMTQAIALANMLRSQGHELARVVVGRSERRKIPDFFAEGILAPLDQVDSPNFITDSQSKSVHIGRTILHALLNFRKYLKSVRMLHQLVERDRPDVIINFYDFIGGIYNGWKSPKVRFICIAHQYLAGHPDFEFPKGGIFDKQSIFIGNRLTSWGAHNRLALSFKELPDQPGISVVPPLLRPIFKSMKSTSGDHLLVYMLNHGYAEEINQFHSRHPDISLHCFWDKPDAPETLVIDEKLIYHQLNADRFLEFMQSCRGYLTTAGFESICEAMYLGKPVLMTPVKGHYEQVCNALDAEKAGAGISSETFDLVKLVDYIPKHQASNEIFKSWCDRSEPIFLANLTQYDH